MMIKVAIVDDSAVMRGLLAQLIDAQPDMEVVGMAPDAFAARALIKATNPDVLTLDVVLPGMNGLDFLERIMRLRPMPVIMVSAHALADSDVTMTALELGAVDFVTKPQAHSTEALEQYAEELADKIRAAARANIDRHEARVALNAPARVDRRLGWENVIAIGASTGGTEAIREILVRMPTDCPAILVTQHMPPGFTQSFAQRLNDLCKISVSEAKHGQPVRGGHAYIAPGHSHLLLEREGSGYVLRLDAGEQVNRHRPSVDVLFRSVAAQAGRHAIGILLTGMGKDGAQGLLEMKQAGASTFAQTEASCVVFGMPREAIALGAADEVLAPAEIPERVLALLRSHGSMEIGTVGYGVRK